MVVEDMPGKEEAPETCGDWLLVFASTIGVAISMLYIYSTGTFMQPLQSEFGWSRAQVSSGITIVSVIAVIMAPFVGMTIDRVGPRRIALTGMILYCGAFAALATTTASIWHWWMLWVLVAFGDTLIKPTVWMSAITSRFNRRRGLAMGLALAGTGVASASMPFVSHFLIESGGWRFAFMVLGGGGAILSLPLMFMFFKEKGGIRPRLVADNATLLGLTRREGLLSGRFHRLAMASLLASTGVLGLAVHFVPILVGQGVSDAHAAAIAGAVGIASIIGRISTGFILDRFKGTVVGAIGFGLPAFACLLLLVPNGTTLYYVACAIVIGFSVGSELDIAAYLSSRYFGRRNYGLLFGTIAGMIALGAGVGSFVAGAVYDYFQTYDPFLLALIPAFVIAAVLVGSLGAYPEFDEKNLNC